MIDDLADVFLDEAADAHVERFAHPAGSARRRPGRRPHPTTGTLRPAGGRAPITCTTCRVTYIAVAVPPSVAPEVWVCDVCLSQPGSAGQRTDGLT